MSELQGAGVLIRPAEAAAIVVEVCSRITRGELRGVPSIHVLRISDSGELFAEGPITAHRATVSRAAQLLDDLLAPSDAPPEYRAPGPLRLALLRARGNVDLPPFTGLDAFASAVARFAPHDSATALRELYQRWQSAAAPSGAPAQELALAEPPAVLPVRVQHADGRELTISDIRRARRATGMSLRELSERSRIPPALLRELEWGYLWNWPGGLYGRTQLVRYARAAGLDERVVVEVTWPMLQNVVDARGGDAVRLIPAEESIDVLLPPPDVSEVPLLRPIAAERGAPRRHRGAFMLAAAAAAALIVSPAAFWLHSRPATAAVANTAHASPAADVTLPSTNAAANTVSGPSNTSAPTPSTAGSPERVNVADAEAANGPVHAVPASAVYSPAFSNEGTAMFFRDDDTASRGMLLKITRVLDGNAHNFHARPSPDGTRIAFDSDREGTRAVYIADQDGHNVRRVSGDGFAAVPSWSPDGTRLAFVKAEADNPRIWNFWIADLASGQDRQVTFNTSGEPWGGSWFPDGDRIAYSVDDTLVVQDLQSGEKRTYHSPIPGRLLRTPAVSPDGRHIIFQVSRDGAWLLNLAKGSMRKVLDDPTAEEYAWSPDGHRVAFHSRRVGGWGVWIMGTI